MVIEEVSEVEVKDLEDVEVIMREINTSPKKSMVSIRTSLKNHQPTVIESQWILIMSRIIITISPSITKDNTRTHRSSRNLTITKGTTEKEWVVNKMGIKVKEAMIEGIIEEEVDMEVIITVEEKNLEVEEATIKIITENEAKIICDDNIRPCLIIIFDKELAYS